MEETLTQAFKKKRLREIACLQWESNDSTRAILIPYRCLLHACTLGLFRHVSATLWSVALQAPPSVGFSRQECWSGFPCPPPGSLPNPGIKHMSLNVSCIGSWAVYH